MDAETAAWERRSAWRVVPPVAAARPFPAGLPELDARVPPWSAPGPAAPDGA